MAESTANGNFLGAATSESDIAAVTVEFSMLDVFEKNQGISQPVCVLDLVLEKWEASDKEETKEEEQTVTPPAAEPSESKWAVGDQCQTVWSKDGKVYGATIVSPDGDQCRVKFDCHQNEEDMPLSALKDPEVIPKTPREWKPGSRCRAVYSVDGLVYPAVVLWVRGQHCKVRFDDYNNKEEVHVSSLLAINELNGPGQTVKGSSRKSGFGSGSGSRRRRNETPDKEDWDQDRDRDKPRQTGWRDDQQTALPWQSKERNLSQSRAEKDTDEKKPTDKPSNQSFLHFPPPLSFQSSGDPMTFIPPPPPPLWACGEKEVSTSLDPTWNMLMLWYMCGFHTGSYLAQQQLKSSFRD